jgi:predicted nucleic acid-binding protein
MAFVLDVSVAACWAFNDEDHPKAAEALDRLRVDEAHAPGLWRFELCNVLVVSERRGRITERDTAQFLQAVSCLPIRLDMDAPEPELVRMARDHGLSVYDAAYLELAARRNLPLATLDNRLARACRAAGVAVI